MGAWREPEPEPRPFKLIPETWCSYEGQEHQTWGLPLECYGVYSFPRTVTGVERGRDGQGMPWSSPSGHGELSWFAQPGQYRSTLVAYFFLFSCDHSMSRANFTYRCGLAHDQSRKPCLLYGMSFGIQERDLVRGPCRYLCSLVGLVCRDQPAHQRH